jgi:hypothetical protein
LLLEIQTTLKTATRDPHGGLLVLDNSLALEIGGMDRAKSYKTV